jgi:predicted Fe-Mo cluster-binding NifX family protein
VERRGRCTCPRLTRGPASNAREARFCDPIRIGPAFALVTARNDAGVKIAVPRMGDNVAPCFEYCATMSVFTIEGNRVVDRLDFPLSSQEPLDRLRLLRDQNVSVIICGGVQDIYERMVRAHGITIIAWVTGAVDDLLGLYLRGQLVPETEQPDRSQAGPPTGRQVSGRRT